MRILLQAIVALSLMTNSAAAQQQVVDWLALPRNEGTESQRRQQRKEYLTQLIDAIDQSLGLTDAQLQRLRVACKGAVEYSFEEEREQNAQKQGRLRPGPIRVTLGDDDAAVAARHAIWTKTLGRMFTEDELSTIKSLEQEQLARLKPRVQVLNRLVIPGGVVVRDVKEAPFRRIKANYLFRTTPSRAAEVPD